MSREPIGTAYKRPRFSGWGAFHPLRLGRAYLRSQSEEHNLFFSYRTVPSPQGTGMKGSVYSRDEAMKMASGGGMSGMGADDDEDDEDDDEDTEEPAAAPAHTVSGVLGSLADAAQARSQNLKVLRPIILVS